MIQNVIKSRVVGIDISNVHTTYAIVDVRGKIIAKDSFPTADMPNINDFVARLSESVLTLVEANGGYETIRSVGVSAPSGNFLTGCIENSPHLPWKGEVPLTAMLRDRMGMAAAVSNTAHVRALGELTFGCAHGMKDFIVVTLGHGVCSCLFSNGHVHLGKSGYAGEFGHICMQENGRPCTCGNRGCLETLCSDEGIMQTAREVMAERSEPSLMRQCEQLSPKEIERMCNEGDELAIEVYRRTGRVLGLGLSVYASVMNPEAVIFTGGIARAGKWLLEPADEAFEEHVFHNVRGRVKFLQSSLGDVERDVLGASVLAWGVKEYSLFK